MSRDEFENLALPHLDAVYRMAMHLARDSNEASDLVQETYLKALKVADRFEERDGGIRPWLFKILHNLSYTEFSNARRLPTPIEELDWVAADGPGPGEPLASWSLADLDWEDVDECLKQAIAELRQEYRTVLLLWAVEGLKYREIAEIEAIPIGTVMSRLHRARRIVATRLLAAGHRASRGAA